MNTNEEGQPRQVLMRLHPPEDSAPPIEGSAGPYRNILIYRKVMKRYLSLFTIYIIATSAAFGAGSATGAGALKREQGAQPVQVYNQGIQLMHSKKFAEAQVKFQQALSENPNFAEAHNNLA
jgi:TolA-binding protein